MPAMCRVSRLTRRGSFDTLDALFNLWDPVSSKDTMWAPLGVCHRKQSERSNADFPCAANGQQILESIAPAAIGPSTRHFLKIFLSAS